MASPPPEYSVAPSGLKPRVRQLTLWRRVRHCVAICPRPLLLSEELLPMLPLLSSSSSLSSSREEGRRRVCTWPDERPTERTGSRGWSAWAKRSAVSGRVQTVSNMFGVNWQ